MMRVAAGAVVALTMTGCASATDTPASTDVTATEPAPTTGAVELDRTDEALPAGRYIRSAFTPPISLTLDDGWQAVQAGSGFFDVQQEVGSPHVIAVQFARPDAVYGRHGAVTPASAEEAVALLQGNPQLEAVEASESRIGGLTGSQVTVDNEGEGHAPVMDVPPGALGIDPGRRLWVAFFDHAEGLVAVMVGGSAERWQEALDAAEPVLESIRFGG